MKDLLLTIRVQVEDKVTGEQVERTANAFAHLFNQSMKASQVSTARVEVVRVESGILAGY